MVQLKHILSIPLAAILSLKTRQLYWANRVPSIVDYCFEIPPTTKTTMGTLSLKGVQLALGANIINNLLL
jgi:hypothetical protein